LSTKGHRTDNRITPAAHGQAGHAAAAARDKISAASTAQAVSIAPVHHIPQTKPATASDTGWLPDRGIGGTLFMQSYKATADASPHLSQDHLGTPDRTHVPQKRESRERNRRASS
jgi:hypothetical protein